MGSNARENDLRFFFFGPFLSFTFSEPHEDAIVVCKYSLVVVFEP